MRSKMKGFKVDEKEEIVKKRGIDGDPGHRRSKSASDRNSEVSRGGALHPKKEIQNEIYPLQASPLSKRTSRAHSPLHNHPKYMSKNSSTQRASLEKDIEQLQLHLQQEKSMRMTLERAMGRVSSTLSPGHRHFAAQAKELIAEIELLEEEVANREQHVLALYRNIFEHCVSQPPSEQSSSVASPAHAKHVSRKHPSIISSAFCSSKKFPLRPFYALVSTNHLARKASKNNISPQLCCKTDIPTEKTCSNPIKAREKVLAMEKNSVLRTLKDHLYQCPSKLSEEMLRCMAAVYCLLGSAASENLKKKRSSVLSNSSSNVIPAMRVIGEDQGLSCKSMVEICWIPTNTSHFSRASFAINNYRVLVEQLERVAVNQMENTAQIAFWINVYNALVMHGYLAYGIPQNSLRRLALFHKAAYNIGGQIISANAIEQSIFCFRTPRIGRWLETILSTALRKKSGEERQHISSKFGLKSCEPLLCFALCTGAFSDPTLKVYTASNVKGELEAAKREFLQENIVVKKSKKVFLPKILERFAREASITSDDLLPWVTDNVDKKLQVLIQKCIDHFKSSKKASVAIDWLPYSSRFRYVFSKDLMEKPWWV